MKIVDDQLCTVIPLYKKEYFLITIKGVMAQTVLPGELRISDDSPSGFLINDINLQAAIRNSLPGVKLSCSRGPKIGPMSNIRQLLAFANLENKYVHILLDDDLIWPNFYQSHLTYLRESNAKCSVSLRFFIDEAGSPIGSPAVPEVITKSREKYVSLDYSLIARSAIPSLNNWMGELSNSVFDGASLLRLWNSPADFRAHGLEDIGTFIGFSKQQTAILICESLGCFRVSSSQNTQNKESDTWKAAVLGWVPLSEMALSDGKISLDEHYECAQRVARIFDKYFKDSDPGASRGLAQYLESGAQNRTIFDDLWANFLDKTLDY
jgi:hypothetical protein